MWYCVGFISCIWFDWCYPTQSSVSIFRILYIIRKLLLLRLLNDIQYMVLLGISLLVMFAVSVAALVTPHSTQENVLLASWSVLSDNDKQIIQSTFNCCGFNNQTRNTHDNTSNDYHPPCNVIPLTNSDVSLPLLLYF